MKRPDYRTLQALDAVIRERGFERAAQKLCITQSAVSQRIKQLENMFGQPLLVRTVPPRPTEQGQKLLALLRQVELLEDEWLGDEQTGSTPLLLSLAVNADSLATWLLPALAPVLADSPIRLNLQVEDETRTQERLRRGEVVGAVSIQHQALPSCLVDKLGALDYLFVGSKPFAERYFPNGVTRSALLKAPAVAFDHLDDMHQAFLQQNFDLPPGSVPCHIVNSSEAFVQLARQGTTCCMIPHLQIEKELESGELIDLSVQLIDLTLELLILGGQRAVGFLGFAELGRDKLCCLIIASLSGLLGLSHSVLQTSILRLELLHLTGKIGDLRIKVGHVRTQRLGGLTAGYRLTSKSLDGFRDLIKEVIDLVDIITFLESNSLEGMLPNILRRQQSHKSCTSLWGIARTYVGLKSECYHDPIVSEHSTWVFMPDICLRRVKNGLRTLSEQHFPVPPAQNTAQ